VSQYSSRLIEAVVQEFSRLPGIGRKTALRLALHLLKKDKSEAEALGRSIIRMREEVMTCKHCHNVSDEEVCGICSDPRRDRTLVCVVEDIRDVMAIENTGQYKGLYHILGGIISPMDGIGPGDLHIRSLEAKVAEGSIQEVIMALPVTMEGDTTNYYLYKKLRDFPARITTLARGISMGDELEYADEVTLGRSILNRVPYENNLKK
jgi:recombination protein RecR